VLRYVPYRRRLGGGRWRCRRISHAARQRLRSTTFGVYEARQIDYAPRALRVRCSLAGLRGLRVSHPLELRFHGSRFARSILVTSSPTRPTRATSSRGSSDDFPVEFATRLPDWSSVVGLLRFIVLHVCPCVVSFSKFHEPDTYDLLRTSSRGCHEDATRMLRGNCFRGI